MTIFDKSIDRLTSPKLNKIQRESISPHELKLTSSEAVKVNVILNTAGNYLSIDVKECFCDNSKAGGMRSMRVLLLEMQH